MGKYGFFEGHPSQFAPNMPDLPVVKIWFTHKPELPLGPDKNITRLKNLRRLNPEKNIHLIVAKKLISSDGLNFLQAFCEENEIKLFDVADFLPQLDELELKLYQILDLELNQNFGCLAAASDIARTFSCVLELGAYMDFDVDILLEEVSADVKIDEKAILLNLGKRDGLLNNDLIYTPNPEQNKILGDVKLNILKNYTGAEDNLNQKIDMALIEECLRQRKAFCLEDFMIAVIGMSGPAVWQQVCAKEFGSSAARLGTSIYIPEEHLGLIGVCVRKIDDKGKQDHSWFPQKTNSQLAEIDLPGSADDHSACANRR
jgi:hypothetical protein